MSAATEEGRPDGEEDSPRAEAFLEILGRVQPGDAEAELSSCGIGPTAEVAEQVLRSRVCYSRPKSAVRFFVWSGRSVKHTGYAWNLLVDILGKADMEEPMWDAVRTMNKEGGGLVTVATFASIFSSYCASGNLRKAVEAFDVMGKYGVEPDAVALNSLLSAMCRGEGRAQAAQDLFERTKATVAPDADTFGILLEAWEKEGNAQRAKSTFGEMIVRVGWDAGNMPAYDAFLSTLVRGDQFGEALKFLQVMRSKGCLPGLKFFARAIDLVVRKRDYANSLAIWQMMISDAGLVPNLPMYNAMIDLCCSVGDTDYALRMLDEMPFNGVFADFITYNAILEGLIKQRKVREAEAFLAEMSKNEQLPSPTNCAAAISMFSKEFNPSAAIDVWHCIVEHQITPADESARELIVGLLDFGRFAEVKKYTDEMLDMGIELPQSTIDNMKRTFDKVGKRHTYDHIARRPKRCVVGFLDEKRRVLGLLEGCMGTTTLFEGGFWSKRYSTELLHFNIATEILRFVVLKIELRRSASVSICNTGNLYSFEIYCYYQQSSIFITHFVLGFDCTLIVLIQEIAFCWRLCCFLVEFLCLRSDWHSSKGICFVESVPLI
uniref:Pentacotripeptide-repeat region of PRORP domain-containing protein n=1 Tax=Oryza nivara TaxID=4536 RepID=A0A0E0H392_ORYNI